MRPSMTRYSDVISVEKLCNSASVDRPLNPILVTCYRRTSWTSPPIGEFEAKLVPYETIDDEVALWFEIAGEIRWTASWCDAAKSDQQLDTLKRHFVTSGDVKKQVNPIPETVEVTAFDSLSSIELKGRRKPKTVGEPAPSIEQQL